MWFVWDGKARQGPYSEAEICRRLSMGQWPLSVWVRPEGKVVYRPALWMIHHWTGQLSSPEQNDESMQSSTFHESTRIAEVPHLPEPPLAHEIGAQKPVEYDPDENGKASPPVKKNFPAMKLEGNLENNKEDLYNFRPDEKSLFTNDSPAREVKSQTKPMGPDTAVEMAMARNNVGKGSSRVENQAIKTIEILQKPPEILVQKPLNEPAQKKTTRPEAFRDPPAPPPSPPPAPPPSPSPASPIEVISEMKSVMKNSSPILQGAGRGERSEFELPHPENGDEIKVSSSKAASSRLAKKLKNGTQKPVVASEGVVNLLESTSDTQIRLRRVNPTAPRRKKKSPAPIFLAKVSSLTKKWSSQRNSLIWLSLASSFLLTLSLMTVAYFLFLRKNPKNPLVVEETPAVMQSLKKDSTKDDLRGDEHIQAGRESGRSQKSPENETVRERQNDNEKLRLSKEPASTSVENALSPQKRNGKSESNNEILLNRESRVNRDLKLARELKAASEAAKVPSKNQLKEEKRKKTAKREKAERKKMAARKDPFVTSPAVPGGRPSLKPQLPQPGLPVPQPSGSLSNNAAILKYIQTTSPNSRGLVTVGPLTLIEKPAPDCQPCSGRGKLADGTVVFLSSVFPEPWAITKNGNVFFVKGFVYQSSQISINVNKISASGSR